MLTNIAKEVRNCGLFQDEKDDFACVRNFANMVGSHSRHDRPYHPPATSSNQIIVKFLNDIYKKRAEKVVEHKNLCELEFKNFKSLFLKYSSEDPSLKECTEIFSGETQSLISFVSGPSGLLTALHGLYAKSYVPIASMPEGPEKRAALDKENTYFEKVGFLISRLITTLFDESGKIVIMRSAEMENHDWIDKKNSITEKDCEFSQDLLPIFVKFEKIFKLVNTTNKDIKKNLLASLREIIKNFVICVTYNRLPVIISRQQTNVFYFNSFYGSVKLGPWFLVPFGIDIRSIAIIPTPIDE